MAKRQLPTNSYNNQWGFGLAEGVSPPQRGESRFESPLGEVPTFNTRLCLEQNCLQWRIPVGNQNKKKQLQQSTNAIMAHVAQTQHHICVTLVEVNH